MRTVPDTAVARRQHQRARRLHFRFEPLGMAGELCP